MYASFFGLRELPFNNTPDPRFFFSTPEHEEALASLIYAVSEGKGFVLLTGEVGSGKTLVSRLMLRHFGEGIAFACINNTQITGAELLHGICMEFAIDVDPQASNMELIRNLQDFLLLKFAENRRVVLMLDEAQALPREAFEQVRMIGNLEADDAKLLQIVIVGQPELRQRFEAEDMRQLRQRLVSSFHLEALNREQAEGYVRHRLGVAGSGRPDEVFSPEAIDAIYKYSKGLPRLINNVCDNAMLSAYAADQKHLDAEFVNGVIQQLMAVDGAERSLAGPGAHISHPASPPMMHHSASAAAMSSSVPSPIVPEPMAPTTAPGAELDKRRADFVHALVQDVDRLRTRFVSQIGEEAERMRRQLAEAEIDSGAAERTRELQQAVRRAIDSRRRLEKVIDEYKSVEGKAKSGMKNLQKFSENARRMLEEARQASSELTKISREAKKAGGSAQDATKLLIEQTGRASRLSATLCQVFDRLDARLDRLRNEVPRLRESGKTASIDDKIRGLKAGTDRNVLAQIAKDHGEDATGSETNVFDGEDQTPAARLARQVEALAALVEEPTSIR